MGGTWNSAAFNSIPWNAPGPAVLITAPTQVICLEATAEWDKNLTSQAIWDIEIEAEVPEC